MPKGIVRTAVKRPLECSHPVFVKQREELLLDDRWRVMHGEKVGELVGVAVRFLEQPIPVKSGNCAYPFAHQCIRLPDHLIAFIQFSPCEVNRMTVIAALESFFPFSLPILFFKTHKIICLKNSEPGSWLS